MAVIMAEPIVASLKSRVHIPETNSHSKYPNTFSVVSYNILADCHIKSNYEYTDAKFLQTTFRHPIILQEIDHLGGDIVCLQEVEPALYHNTMEPKLGSLGYCSIFQKRTYETHDEGCATFVNKKVFDCLESTEFILGDLANEIVSSCQLSADDYELAQQRYVDKPDVFLISKLRHKDGGQELVVGNVHINYGDMKIPDVQALQIYCCLKKMRDYSGSSVQILCGDFNVYPSWPQYHIVREGGITEKHLAEILEHDQLRDKPDIKRVFTSIQSNLSTVLPLRSAYNTLMGSEPEVTCVDDIWRCCLDYIFYRGTSIKGSEPECRTEDAVVPLSVLKVADLGDILKATPPSNVYPSDHFPLLCRFGLST